MRRDDPTRNPELSGYSFWPMGEADRVDYERLVSRLLPDIGIGHSRPLHGIKTIDPDGSVCAAIRTTARRFDANVILFVEALAVSESRRGRNIGGGLLYLLDSAAPRECRWAAGSCKPVMRGYYRDHGFTVGDPGRPLLLPDFELASLDSVYSCWFARRLHPRAGNPFRPRP